MEKDLIKNSEEPINIRQFIHNYSVYLQYIKESGVKLEIKQNNVVFIIEIKHFTGTHLTHL